MDGHSCEENCNKEQKSLHRIPLPFMYFILNKLFGPQPGPKWDVQKIAAPVLINFDACALRINLFEKCVAFSSAAIILRQRVCPKKFTFKKGRHGALCFTSNRNHYVARRTRLGYNILAWFRR